MVKMKHKWKQKLAGVTAVLILFSFAHDHKYDPHYEILEDSDAFASYSDGLIYIGDDSFLESITPEEGDILVRDHRFDQADADFKIYDSFRIHDRDIRNDILEALLEYERLHPSPWDRTIESLRLEWLMHNISYFFDYETHRSGDVDLDNDEQDKYDQKILNKIFHI